MNETPKNLHLITKDFLISGEEFHLVYDTGLDMLRTHPQPEELSSYYESKGYISHTDSKKGLMASLYQKVKRRALRKKVKLIGRMNQGIGSVLDIGAGTGDFLLAARNKGWKTEGVEVNSGARNLAQEKGIMLKRSMDDFSGRQFDVVTLWHVLEHLPDLENTVTRISSLVKPNGVLIVAVPNFRSYDAKHYKTFWAAYDVPRHLWHFSKRTMQKLFSDSMDLQRIKPMIFDSFYVSLLSEKYKSGNSFSIRGLWIGFWSNCSALFTKEYSSLIYCFRKTN